MKSASQFVLYSGGASGAEAVFGQEAERYGVKEVNFSFAGHHLVRERGVRLLDPEDLALKDISMTYVSRLMNRKYPATPRFRELLQSICWQVASGREVFIVGAIQPNATVKGGTGWGAEYAKITNKPLHVFDQAKGSWFFWDEEHWVRESGPVVTQAHFTGSGTRLLEDSGRAAIAELFARSFAR